MKIALINSPIRLSGKPSNLPIGLAIVASVLRNKGHEIVFIDLNARRDRLEVLSEVFDLLEEAEVVGISGLITTYAFQKDLSLWNPCCPTRAAQRRSRACERGSRWTVEHMLGQHEELYLDLARHEEET